MSPAQSSIFLILIEYPVDPAKIHRTFSRQQVIKLLRSPENLSMSFSTNYPFAEMDVVLSTINFTKEVAHCHYPGLQV